ncbi:hypothetical protein SAMN00777080_0880 [Aquiflexum balticum DSM 16537]|uniref:Uncharacterized protein n=1 Tax=Aquiflexum balticum DSM 16537 TaxID=758820 RepID=A0A1W2H0A5_9BACT|nr:hypothetical protein SAMN00777080_0880 [Aquiflexum balticum DSM 16537]
MMEYRKTTDEGGLVQLVYTPDVVRDTPLVLEE